MNKKQIAKTLLLASWTGTFAESLLVPFFAVLTNRIGGTILDAGIGAAIFSMATGIFVSVLAHWDFFSRHLKGMVLIGFVLAGIGDLSYLFVHTITALFIVEAFLGFALGILNTSWDALYSEGLENYLTGWANWNGGISFIEGIAFFVGGFIVQRFGFNVLFITMAIFDLISVFYAYKVWKTK